MAELTKTQKKALLDLGPWHFKIKVSDTEYTTDFNTTKISLIDPSNLTNLLRRIYPQGRLDGKTFLDAGCNGGGYCMTAFSRGAKEVFGFDVRDHWINQANYLRDHIFKYPKSKVKFKTTHLEDLSEDKKYDVTLFKGVLYHLPDPIAAIKKLCTVTNEVMIIDTAGSVNAPENCLELYFEKPGALMNGVDNLAWLPGGPKVVGDMCHWMGFKEYRVINQDNVYQPNGYTTKFMRFRIIAARHQRYLNRYDRIIKERGEVKGAAPEFSKSTGSSKKITPKSPGSKLKKGSTSKSETSTSNSKKSSTKK